ncbi:MAG: hypothetical protein HEEMFOPI_01920 [Holosporales bacterium]
MTGINNLIYRKRVLKTIAVVIFSSHALGISVQDLKGPSKI